MDAGELGVQSHSQLYRELEASPKEPGMVVHVWEAEAGESQQCSLGYAAKPYMQEKVNLKIASVVIWIVLLHSETRELPFALGAKSMKKERKEPMLF